MVGSGTINLNHVCVLITRSGIQGDVSLQESTVPMEESGIPPFMPAHALLAPSPTSTNVILSPPVEMASITTPSTINVNAPTP